MAITYDHDDKPSLTGWEDCQFSEEELQVLHERELEGLEQRVPMNAAERKALRKWVASGHSCWESPGSRYICDLGMDFLDVYRADREIAAATRGMTPRQKEAYIKEYTGYKEPTPDELQLMDAIRNTPAYVSSRYEKLAHKLRVLRDYIEEKGLDREAGEYLEAHLDDKEPLPFSFILG